MLAAYCVFQSATQRALPACSLMQVRYGRSDGGQQQQGGSGTMTRGGGGGGYGGGGGGAGGGSGGYGGGGMGGGYDGAAAGGMGGGIAGGMAGGLPGMAGMAAGMPGMGMQGMGMMMGNGMVSLVPIQLPNGQVCALTGLILSPLRGATRGRQWNRLSSHPTELPSSCFLCRLAT